MFFKANPLKHILLALILILSGCASQTANVQQGDPAKSFFKDQVTYPYRVHYAHARDNGGGTWEIGYMDVKPMFPVNPKVLVMIHGRGFSGAYFSHLIQVAHKKGIRIIVPDLPNYGKSIPGNMDMPLVRTMQQTREIIHDLVVNQLGISKAVYGGHSLGGQFVLGYALTYPEAVDKLILEAPAGLEELPAKYFPPVLAQKANPDAFTQFPYYAKKVRLDFSTNAQLIDDLYFYRLKIKGKLVPLGFFKEETQDALLATQIRTKMITGNPVEFKRYSITSFRDIYNLGVEIQREDPDSLFKRYTRISQPILLVFGEEEPFYPKKISGLKDLKADMIQPFFQRMTTAGCPVTIKLYPGCGHFPHADQPDLFANDVAEYILTGDLASATDPQGI